jgi:multidrug resistance efflux pump
MALRHHSLVAVRFLFAAAVVSAPLGCSVPETPPETPPPHVVKWEGMALVTLQEWTELLGTVQPLPDRVARVTAPVEGQVVAVLPKVTEGTEVEPDTVLVQLNPTIAQANAEKARALKEALDQELQQARSALPFAQKKYDSLKDVPMVPELQKEEARLGVEDAKSKLIAAEKRLLAGEKEMKAAAEQVQLYTLKAGLKGRLDRILVSRGQTIPAGTVVAEVANVETEVDVLCFVPASALQKLKIDQDAEVGPVLYSETSTVYTGPTGKIKFIADRADPDTGNFAVKVRFENSAKPAYRLRPNMPVRIRVITGMSSNPSIRESAVLEDTDPPTVVIVEAIEVKKDKEGKEETFGKARRVQVKKIGLRDRVQGQIEILELWDDEKKQKWEGEQLQKVQFVLEKHQGLATDDVLKLEVEEEPPDEAPKK